MLEPRAESKKRNDSKRSASRNQKYFMRVLLKALLANAKNPKRAVVRIRPVSCHGKSL